MTSKPMTGDELRRFRMARGHTQEKFADWLNENLGKKYEKEKISRWENGAIAVPQHVCLFLRSSQPPAPKGIPAAQNCGDALVVVFSNQKGGVGKTSGCVNTAYRLAKQGKRILVVDCDSQGSATVHLGCFPRDLEVEKRTLTAVLGESKPVRDCIVPVCDGLFDLLGTSIALAQVEGNLASDHLAALILREKLGEVARDYDVILIDTPPNLGLLTSSALNAADYVIIPSQTEQLSIMGIPMLLDAVEKVRRRVNRNLKVLGVLPTHLQVRAVLDRTMMDELHGLAHENNIAVFSPIRFTVAYKEAVAIGKPALAVDPTIAGAESYEEIAAAINDALAQRATTEPSDVQVA